MAIKKMKAVILSTLAKVLSHKEMRPVVRLFTTIHVHLYRLSDGRAQQARYPTLLLTTKGRKTGKLYTIPLLYVVDGDRFVIAAAYAGSPTNPAWWLNLQHTKEAVIEVKSRKLRVHAELASVEEREVFWKRLVAMYPSFVEYQQRTTREIPVIVLQPVKSPERVLSQ